MLRRSFLINLSTLFGSTFAASNAYGHILSSKQLLESDKDLRNRCIVYELSGSFANEVTEIYNFENLEALKNRYKSSGKLVSVKRTCHHNYRKIVMIFDSVDSKNQYIGEYKSNIAKYKKIIS